MPGCAIYAGQQLQLGERLPPNESSSAIISSWTRSGIVNSVVNDDFDLQVRRGVMEPEPCEDTYEVLAFELGLIQSFLSNLKSS